MRFLPAALAFFLASPQSQLTETIEVRLHTVDVVVTNAKGEPVTGLRAEDFEILEDGTPQKITNFSAFSDATAEPAVSPSTSPDVAAPATVTRAQAPPPRTIVFFIDEMGLARATRDDLLANLRAFTANLRDGDRAVVVRPAEATAIALNFTDDHEVIERELDAALADTLMTAKRSGVASDYYWYKRDLLMTSGSDAERNVVRRSAARTRERVKQRLGTLRAIIAAIAPLDGRKVLIGVTQSLSGEPGREFFDDYSRRNRRQSFKSVTESLDRVESVQTVQSSVQPSASESERGLVVRDLRPAIADIARIASSNGVTFYAIRPESDLTLTDASPSMTELSTEDYASMSGPDTSNLLFMQAAIANTQNGVNPLVDITGGRHFDPGDRFSDVMHRIASDLSSYYSLAYHGRAGLDRPHKIAVRVRNRPELKVRARSEVESKSAPRELTDRVVSSLVAPQAPNDLGIALRTESKPSGKGTTLTIDILIPLAGLQFEKAGDVYRARYSAHYAVTGKATDFISGVDRDRAIEIPARDFAVARTKHWTHTVTMSGSGTEYRVAAGVMDLNNERSGIATIDVTR